MLGIIGHLAFAGPVGSKDPDEPLSQMLKKAAEHCERLKNLALHFVCHEEITIEANTYTRIPVQKRVGLRKYIASSDLKLQRVELDDYLYDYQVIRKGEENSERRVLLRHNERTEYREDADLPYQRFWSELLVFGPVGFLSEYWQPHFDFVLTGSDRFQGNDVMLVEASPISPRSINNNYATLWVDKRDYRVRKIVWDPRSLPDLNNEVSTTLGGMQRELLWSVEYGVEKNGVLFPSRQIIEEILISPAGRKHLRYAVTVLYQNYRFFTVETEVKYRSGFSRRNNRPGGSPGSSSPGPGPGCS